jgi:hypothetical protein
MKLLGAMIVVAALALAGVVGFAMLNLRALIGVHRDRLVTRIEAMLGRPVAVGDVVPSWWPLGVRLRAVTIGESPAFGTGSFLDADGIVLTVRPWPLLRGHIEAAGLTLERPRLSLVRDAEGRWNVGSLGEATSSGEAGHSGAKDRRRTMRLPLEWMVGIALSNVHDGTVVVDDRSGGTTRQLTLRHVRLRAEDVFLGATARVRVEAALFAGDAPDLELDARVPQLGLHELEQAPFAVRLELRDVDLAGVRAWTGAGPALQGRVERVVVDAEGIVGALQERSSFTRMTRRSRPARSRSGRCDRSCCARMPRGTAIRSRSIRPGSCSATSRSTGRVRRESRRGASPSCSPRSRTACSRSAPTRTPRGSVASPAGSPPIGRASRWSRCISRSTVCRWRRVAG